MLGDRGVAIALDGMDGDAEGGEFLGVHVAPRAGAEKNDMAERGASGERRGRKRGMIIEHEIIPGQQSRQIVGRDAGGAVDGDRRVAGAVEARDDRRHGFVRIEKKTAHEAAPG